MLGEIGQVLSLGSLSAVVLTLHKKVTLIHIKGLLIRLDLFGPATIGQWSAFNLSIFVRITPVEYCKPVCYQWSVNEHHEKMQKTGSKYVVT